MPTTTPETAALSKETLESPAVTAAILAPLQKTDYQDLQHVWVVTCTCCATGRWYIRSVHASEVRAQLDVESATRNRQPSECFTKERWVVIPALRDTSVACPTNYLNTQDYKHQLRMKRKVELTSIARSFASDLAQLPEWNGPKDLDQFSDEDWTRFSGYVTTNDGTLSEDDQELCEEIASAIENA